MGIVEDGEDEVDVPVVVEKKVEIKKRVEIDGRKRIPRSVIAVVLSKYLLPVFWAVVVMLMVKRYGKRFLEILFK
jgi:hypothetical protein